MHIREDDLSAPEVVALLEAHLAHCRASSPPESVHALSFDGLKQPHVTCWTAWRDGSVAGVGALAELDPAHGEIKSMHTAAAHRRAGVAEAMLAHILSEAWRRGYRRISLETGSMEAFAAARALYARNGFSECGPFAAYALDPNSVFMTMALEQA